MDTTILIKALDAVEKGEAIGSILERYPQYAAELRPFLTTAGHLSDAKPAPSAEAKSQSLAAVLAYADAMTATATQRRPLIMPWFRRLFFASAMLFILFLAFIPLTASALPGDFLYEPKRVFENIRYSIAGDPERQQLLEKEINGERRREIKALLAATQKANVEFEGIIELMSTGEWVVSGIEVHLLPDTKINGEMKLNQWVKIYGSTTNDGLFMAARVVTASGDPITNEAIILFETATATPGSTVTETPTDTATSSATPSNTATATAEATQTEAPTGTSVPTATSTMESSPEPTMTLTPFPTATEVEEEDGEDEEEENEDEDDQDEEGEDEPKDEDGDDQDEDGGDEPEDEDGDDQEDEDGDDQDEDGGDDDEENENEGGDDEDEEEDDE